MLAGVLFYFVSISVDGKLSDLLINISAAFIVVPLLYVFYEVVRSASRKKLNETIFDYAKMQVDRELLSLLNQLQKLVLTMNEQEFSQKAVNEFLVRDEEFIEKKLITSKHLGFQVLKHWETGEKGLHDLLKNAFILESMENEQVIAIVEILARLRELESIQKVEALYIETNETANEYKVVGGANYHMGNQELPDRHLLLKYLEDDKFIVCDFGDIAKYNLGKCLKYFKINDKIARPYAKVIFNLLGAINTWLDATNLEFIVDEKMFRTNKAPSYK